MFLYYKSPDSSLDKSPDFFQYGDKKNCSSRPYPNQMPVKQPYPSDLSLAGQLNNPRYGIMV